MCLRGLALAIVLAGGFLVPAAAAVPSAAALEAAAIKEAGSGSGLV